MLDSLNEYYVNLYLKSTYHTALTKALRVDNLTTDNEPLLKFSDLTLFSFLLFLIF